MNPWAKTITGYGPPCLAGVAFVVSVPGEPANVG